MLAGLAERLLVEVRFLEDIVELLEDKGQVILYGPPGTGKTYLARELARVLAIDESCRALVQFHPSTSYEDFFEGYRPVGTGDGGGIRYELTPGPLARMAERASAAPKQRHVMIIDEINRGNLPRVLGELLFLLEYRDESVQTLYRPYRPFKLPKNLWFIGTMNTADRSIALVDAALRRRFHFVPFFPDRDPIAGLLGRWLAKEEEPAWVSRLVDAVNSELERCPRRLPSAARPQPLHEGLRLHSGRAAGATAAHLGIQHRAVHRGPVLRRPRQDPGVPIRCGDGSPRPVHPAGGSRHWLRCPGVPPRCPRPVLQMSTPPRRRPATHATEDDATEASPAVVDERTAAPMAVAVDLVRQPQGVGERAQSPQPERADVGERSGPQTPGEQFARTLTLREHGSEVLELTGDQAGALNRVGGGKYLSVEPSEPSGHWQVSARHYVGSINVGGLQVLVRPKIPLRNLFLLLEVGLRERDWRDEATRYETTGDLLPALVSFFARAAETTLARGLYHSYRERRDRLVAMRGRIDIERQLTRPGVVIPTACRFTDFTADLIENSYMKAAVSRSLRVAGVQPVDRRRLMQHLVTLEDVGDVRHHPFDYEDVVFTRLNEHYRPALRLARLVLENLTLQDTIGEVHGVVVHAGHEPPLRTVRHGAAAAGAARAPRREGSATETTSTPSAV